MQSAVNKAIRFGRATMVAIGLGVSLALVLGATTVALAAVPGDPFKLGQVNIINGATTTLQGSGPGGVVSKPLFQVSCQGTSGGPALSVDNGSSSGAARGIDINVPNGKMPINVNSGAGKSDLNVDRLDGKSEQDFLPNDTYVAEATEFGVGGGTDVRASADCDAGDTLLGGGGNAPGDGDQVTFSSPFLGEGVQGWDYGMIDNDIESLVEAFALCADLPPEHQD